MASKKRAAVRKSANHESLYVTLLIGLIVLLCLGASWYLWYFYTLR